MPLKRLQRLGAHDPKFVFLENRKMGVKIPLENNHGLLQGVFETPKGEILEVRKASWDGAEYKAFVSGGYVGDVTSDLYHRFVNSDYRRQGIGSALFDLAERNAVANKYWGEKMVFSSTRKRDAALFLLKRGYKLHGGRKKLALNWKDSQPDQYLPRDYFLEKTVRTTPFDNHSKWHRIKVIGQHGKAKGKPIWLTIRAVLLTTAK